MSHDLLVEKGKASMMYVGQPPWHQLGTRLHKPATARKAIRAAGLDWTVSKVARGEVFASLDRSPDKTHAIVRHDPKSALDGATLGFVSSDYTPLQNREAFAFFDTIVGQGAAVFHTAGALGKGEIVWILAKLPIPMRVANHDLVDKFLLLSNSHDGRGGVEIRLTPVRVVCANTLTMALLNNRGFHFEHSSDLAWQLELTAQNLRVIDREFDEIEAAYQQMARVQLTSAELDYYFGGLLQRYLDRTNGVLRRDFPVLRARLQVLFVTGAGNQLPGVRGTLWAAYNAVTELVDHHLWRQSPDEHLRNIWLGRGADLKAEALQLAQHWIRTGAHSLRLEQLARLSVSFKARRRPTGAEHGSGPEAGERATPSRPVESCAA